MSKTNQIIEAALAALGGGRRAKADPDIRRLGGMIRAHGDIQKASGLTDIDRHTRLANLERQIDHLTVKVLAEPPAPAWTPVRIAYAGAIVMVLALVALRGCA